MSNTKLSEKRWFRYVIFLLLWVIIIGVSFQGSQRLNSNIESSTNIISTDTPAYKASDLVNQRFNGTENSIQHIIVLQLNQANENITDSKWDNYTLFLGLMLYNQMKDKGYDSVLSYPIIVENLKDLPNVKDVASSFVSKDGKTGLIFLIFQDFE